MGRFSVFGFVIPDEALILLLVGAGFAVMLRQRGLAKGLILLALAIAILPPFLEPFLVAMPNWLMILIMVFVGLSILRGVAVLFLGARAADSMVGALAADVVRSIFRFIFRR